MHVYVCLSIYLLTCLLSVYEIMSVCLCLCVHWDLCVCSADLLSKVFMSAIHKKIICQYMFWSVDLTIYSVMKYSLSILLFT